MCNHSIDYIQERILYIFSIVRIQLKCTNQLSNKNEECYSLKFLICQNKRLQTMLPKLYDV